MKTLAVLLLNMVAFSLFAQKHEIGLQAGATSLLGDFGGGPGNGTLFIKDLDLRSTRATAGFFYRYNLHPNLSLRAELSYINLAGNDDFSAEPNRYARGLQSKVSGLAANARVEYNILKLPLCRSTNGFTPFLAAGLGVAQVNTGVSHRSGNAIETSDNPLLQNEVQYLATGSTTALQVPLSAGIKYNIKRNWLLQSELTYAMVFSDALDGYVRQQNDHYLTLTAGVSYVFCRSSRSVSCPTY